MDGDWLITVTAQAPSNIAVIKYWGKRNEELILPLNGSLSVTLHVDDLCATTTVAVSPKFTSDKLWLNGKEVSLDTHRYRSCLQALRSRASTVKRKATSYSSAIAGNSNAAGAAEEEIEVTADTWQSLKLHVVSKNNFPTAAGLASSAAGFACLVFALSQLMGVEESYAGELTSFARMGSGSACRSLYGGFVCWERGEAEDGRDSIARQVATEEHWDDLVILIAVVKETAKDIGSSDGMRRSVQTSPLLLYRAKEVVPARLKAMEVAVQNKAFADFARLTCTDSNQFHATCLDTAPPIFYLNDTSRRVISFVESYNSRRSDGPAVAYTFDAGPNAVMLVQRPNAAAFLSDFLSAFPPPPEIDTSKYVTGRVSLVSESLEKPSAPSGEPGILKYILVTQPGPGARVLSKSVAGSLLTTSEGLSY